MVDRNYDINPLASICVAREMKLPSPNVMVLVDLVIRSAGVGIGRGKDLGMKVFFKKEEVHV